MHQSPLSRHIKGPSSPLCTSSSCIISRRRVALKRCALSTSPDTGLCTESFAHKYSKRSQSSPRSLTKTMILLMRISPFSLIIMKEISIDDHPQAYHNTHEEPNGDEERHVDPQQYLFHGHSYYPVQEYLLTSAEDWTSSTPSFILTVTWPRMALFYHPKSPLCQDMQVKFVQLARHIRHHMTGKQGMVEFWAVSCQVHEVSCQELGITKVPYLLGFPQGRIEGIPIPRTMENNIDVTWALQSIDMTLQKEAAGEEQEEKGNTVKGKGDGEGNEIDQREEGEIEQEPVEEDLDESHPLLHPHGNVAIGTGGVGKHNLLLADSSSSTSSSYDVFHDATSSFLYHLDQILAVIARTPHHDSPQQRQVLYRQQQVLKEWFDLLHWTLPSRSFAPVHDILNDLRNTKHQSYLQPQLYIKHILSSHGYYQRPDLYKTWSKNCNASCGFWKLFHIISIGVVEQHGQVMGDVNRVTVRHAWEVMLQLVTTFGFVHDDVSSNDRDRKSKNKNKERISHKRDQSQRSKSVATQKLLQQEYQYCIKTPACRRDMGVDSRISASISSTFRRAAAWLSRSAAQDTNLDDNTSKILWQPLAIWLWKVHNVYRRQIGNDGSWPSPSKCHACYITNRAQQNEAAAFPTPTTTWLEEQEDVFWDLTGVYSALRKTYWPHGIQSPRLVVLDRHHQYRQLYLQATPNGVERLVWFLFVFCTSILVIAAVFCSILELIRWYNQRQQHYSKSYFAKHKKDMFDDPFRTDFPISYGSLPKRSHLDADKYDGPRRRAWESLWR